jgi:hypothetical protein
LEGSSCGPILKYYPGIRLEGLRKTTKNLYPDIQLVCSLFNDVLCISDYTASNEEMIAERYIGKDEEGTGCGLI